MFKIFITRNYDKLVKFVLNEYQVADVSWKVVVFDGEESKAFFNDRLRFNRYKNEILNMELNDQNDDPDSSDEFLAHCIPCNENLILIKQIKEKSSGEVVLDFDRDTNFIQKLFNTYQAHHLILLNDEIFSNMLRNQRTHTLCHEAYHIVEYETYNQGDHDQVDDEAEILAEDYFKSLSGREFNREYDKICSGNPGNQKYGRIRLVTKFKC